ncbi:hypothetical protein FIBSPDRAFT_551918 [Athelia psychrophila]|uniref:Uncharacterized protein n=1 Tax=Athelia psychrophila TaxID=1759441 RepID=A0A166UVK4_9AGAM|nr:hypothetical protein FIBSPDRAFT_551918 [Fibularhizoctonia sp. CBS 109695]
MSAAACKRHGYLQLLVPKPDHALTQDFDRECSSWRYVVVLGVVVPGAAGCRCHAPIFGARRREGCVARVCRAGASGLWDKSRAECTLERGWWSWSARTEEHAPAKVFIAKGRSVWQPPTTKRGIRLRRPSGSDKDVPSAVDYQQRRHVIGVIWFVFHRFNNIALACAIPCQQLRPPSPRRLQLQRRSAPLGLASVRGKQLQRCLASLWSTPLHF